MSGGAGIFGLTSSEALKYLKSKGLKLTYHYDEMMHEAHDKAFTVAKVTRADLLDDIHVSLQEALESGATFEEWQKKIKPTLQKKGWYGAVSYTHLTLPTKRIV